MGSDVKWPLIILLIVVIAIVLIGVFRYRGGLGARYKTGSYDNSRIVGGGSLTEYPLASYDNGVLGQLHQLLQIDEECNQPHWKVIGCPSMDDISDGDIPRLQIKQERDELDAFIEAVLEEKEFESIQRKLNPYGNTPNPEWKKVILDEGETKFVNDFMELLQKTWFGYYNAVNNYDDTVNKDPLRKAYKQIVVAHMQQRMEFEKEKQPVYDLEKQLLMRNLDTSIPKGLQLSPPTYEPVSTSRDFGAEIEKIRKFTKEWAAYRQEWKEDIRPALVKAYSGRLVQTTADLRKDYDDLRVQHENYNKTVQNYKSEHSKIIKEWDKSDVPWIKFKTELPENPYITKARIEVLSRPGGYKSEIKKLEEAVPKYKERIKQIEDITAYLDYQFAKGKDYMNKYKEYETDQVSIKSKKTKIDRLARKLDDRVGINPKVPVELTKHSESIYKLPDPKTIDDYEREKNNKLDRAIKKNKLYMNQLDDLLKWYKVQLKDVTPDQSEIDANEREINDLRTFYKDLLLDIDFELDEIDAEVYGDEFYKAVVKVVVGSFETATKYYDDQIKSATADIAKLKKVN